MKILMVCLGNICRSPLAEGILDAKAKVQGIAWEIDSAGTGAWNASEQAALRSIEVARKHEVVISRQRSRQIMELL